MITRKAALPALALAIALGAAAGLGVTAAPGAFAQATTAPQQTQPDQQTQRPRVSPERRVEGRIAALKAELQITGAQEAQFDQVAQAMRDNARAFAQAAQQKRAQGGQAASALGRLEARAQFANLRAQADQRLLDAFRPLYASLSDEQKKTADAMLAPHGHGHFRRG